ncbi:DUF3426 domain-containing protein [Motiliproteus sp.]|uniref:DUF3426 domain-containing protein n=1 Tax=Motiliproteus sp. TaxID=1898955 RepID=UPI003BAAD8D2
MSQSFITQCPACHTRFELSNEQLNAAGGQVRCGNCLKIFSADQHLEGSSMLDAGIPRESLILSTERPRRSAVTLAWVLLVLLALAGLAGQVLWFERDSLSQHPQLGQFYGQVCQRIDCQLPPRQDLPSIRSQQLLVRQHPDYTNALSLHLTLLNLAPFEQPFPALKLSFSGLDETLRAARIFQPREYLGGDIQPGELMPSNSPVQIQLELLDPGSQAPNYQLQFLPAKAVNLYSK